VVGWKKDGSDQKVTVNLTAAYRKQAKTVTRRATFGSKDGHFLIEDHLKEPTGAVRWAVVTRADFEIDGAHLTLKQSGKRLVITRLDTAGGEWEEFSLKPSTARENQNEGFHLLGFTAQPKEALTLQVAWKLE